MSYQQNKQKCQIPAKILPKCPPKCPPQAPQAPASCLAPGPAPFPAPPSASSCCAPSCCVSGFGSSSCCLLSHRFPRVYLRQPQNPDCCENESSGCSSCCHGSGDCS